MCGRNPCWQPKGASLRYANRAGTPSGLTKISLNAGADGQAKVQAQGKGSDLLIAPLPLGPHVTVQLRRDNSGICFEATFGTDVRKNDSEIFSAKSD